MSLADATAATGRRGLRVRERSLMPSTCDPLAIYDKTKENILMLSEVDPGLHTFMEQNKTNAAMLTWNAYPGALRDALLHDQRPVDARHDRTEQRSVAAVAAVRRDGSRASRGTRTKNPLDAMLRYVGVGTAGYDFHPHSNHEHVIAEDGALMKGTNRRQQHRGEVQHHGRPRCHRRCHLPVDERRGLQRHRWPPPAGRPGRKA